MDRRTSPRTQQRFVVTVDGIEHTVIVTRGDDATSVRAIVDGRELDVLSGPHDVAIVRPVGGDTQVRVHLDGADRPAQAHADGRVYALTTRTAREAALAAVLRGGSAGSGDDATIRAPMPGRVVRVLVGVGDTVAADAPLVIVEAMKMENEVRAPAAGRVRSIAVAAGATVESGQLLCELEPQPVA